MVLAIFMFIGSRKLVYINNKCLVIYNCQGRLQIYRVVLIYIVLYFSCAVLVKI